MAKNANAIRQGDVYLIRRDALPAGLVPAGSNTVALGETTGHHHTLAEAPNVEVLKDPKTGALWIRVDDPVETPDQGGVIGHQEHGGIRLEPGIYEFGPQREYEPEGWRRVVD